MGKFETADLDGTIHGKVRLGIMAYLASVGSASFTDLREKTSSTDGNLSTHLSKLEKAEYVRIDKRFAGRKPLTTITLTRTGRTAWIEYLTRMQVLLAGDVQENDNAGMQ